MSKNLKDGQIENETHRRCTQTKCSYFINGGCKECDDCGSEPFVLNKSCDRCYKCENVPNELRFDDPNAQEQSESEKEVIRAMEHLAEAVEKLQQEKEEKEEKPKEVELIPNSK